MKRKFFFLFLFIIMIFSGCDNTKKIQESRKISDAENEDLENIKNIYQDSLISLRKDVNQISNKKESIIDSKKFSEAFIYNILQDAYFDHIVIGVNDLNWTSKFFSEVLGFEVKRGNINNLGISSLFIEFQDSTEIEFIEVNDPKDNLSIAYENSIRNGNFGLQFALRVNKIKELNNHFNNVNSQYTKLSENVSYTTLSESEFDVRMPLFFIKYNIRNFNDSFNHENKAVGINSIWLGSTELKQDILELVDYGFELIDILIIEPLNKKAFLMVNNNFNVKIFENDKDVIEGLSIKTNDINYIKERLVNAEIPFEEKVTLKKRQLILNPEVTNSLFFEFIE